MWGRGRDNDLRDEHLRAELDRLVPAMPPEGEWAKVLKLAESKTFVVSPGVARDAVQRDAAPVATKTHPTESHLVSRDGRRRSAFAYAAISFAVLVLLAGLGTGIFEAVTHLGGDQPIVVITDDTIGISPGSTGQTTQTAASAETTAQSGSWERLPLTTEGGVVRILVMDPTDPSVLYAAVASSGLFRSTDGAESWERLPLDEGDVWLIGVDPNSPPTVYVYAGDYSEPTLFRSDDGGTTWKELATAPAPFVYNLPSLWIDPTSSPSTIYTAAQSGGVWRSTDRGETWPGAGAAPTTAVDAHKQSLPPAVQQALDAFRAPFEATGSNVTVTDSDTGFPIEAGMSPWTLRVDPNDPSIFYLGTDQGVYKSPDGGKTWRKSSVGLTSWAVSWVEPDPDSAFILYAGVPRGIVRSDDGGETWRLILSDGDSLVIAPSESPRLYATTPEGLFRSSDGGETWNLSLAGEGPVVIAPSSPSRLYASREEGLFRSDDGGESWSRLAGDIVNMPSFADYQVSDPCLVAADNPDIVLATGGVGPGGDEDTESPPPYARCLFRSTDGGDTWSLVLGGDTPLGEGDSDVLDVVVAAPSDTSFLYAERQLQMPEDPDFSNVLLKSTDTGATWTVISPDEWVADRTAIVSIAVDPRTPSTVYVLRYLSPLSTTGVSPVLVRSLDGGASWEEVQVPASRWGNLPLFDPHSEGTLYVGGPDYGIYRSDDGGGTWQDITGDLPVKQRIDFVISPASNRGVYAAADNGLYRWLPGDR